jgi:hypothetical protein
MGCKCPEEVFEHIEVDSTVKLSEGITINHKINVGNRLLVYIVDGDNPEVKENFGLLIEAGLRERDSKGFNRLRFAVIADNLHQAEMEELEMMVANIEKVHIHFIRKNELSDLSF